MLDQYQFLKFLIEAPYSYQKFLLTREILRQLVNDEPNGVLTTALRKGRSGVRNLSYYTSYYQGKILSLVSDKDDNIRLTFQYCTEFFKDLPNFFPYYGEISCYPGICNFNQEKYKVSFLFTEPIENNPIDYKLDLKILRSLYLQAQSVVEYCATKGILISGQIDEIFTYIVLPEKILVPLFGKDKSINTRYLLKLLPQKLNFHSNPQLVKNSIDSINLQFDFVKASATSSEELKFTSINQWILPQVSYREHFLKLLVGEVRLPPQPKTLSDPVDVTGENDKGFYKIELAAGLEFPELDYIKERASALDTYSLIRLSKERSVAAHKIFAQIVNISKNSNLLRDYMDNYRILQKGSFGQVSVALREGRELFAYKTGLDSSSELYQENLTGQLLNRLRDKIPNFMYVYGCLTKTRGFCHLLCGDLLLVEMINDAQLLKKVITKLPSRNNILLQLINALYLAYNSCKFTHNDLHESNILVQSLPQPVSIPIYDSRGEIMFYLNSNQVARIIDYGKARVVYQGVVFEHSKKYAEVPFNDIISLLIFFGIVQPKYEGIYEYLTNRNFISDRDAIMNARLQNDEKDFAINDPGFQMRKSFQVRRADFLKDNYITREKIETIMKVLAESIPESISDKAIFPAFEDLTVKPDKYYRDLLYNFSPPELAAEKLLLSFNQEEATKTIAELENSPENEPGPQHYNEKFLRNRLEEKNYWEKKINGQS